MKGTDAKFGREKLKRSHYCQEGMVVTHDGSVTMQCQQMEWLCRPPLGSHSPALFGSQAHAASQTLPQAHGSHLHHHTTCDSMEVVSNPPL